jgi:hypothetical protein
MVHLTEMHKITILQMIGYGDHTRTQNEVVHLFRQKFPNLPPITQGTISKIERQFREHGHVRGMKKEAANTINDDTKLDIMLEFEENPHTSSRKAASIFNVGQTSIIRTLKENKMHPYKMTPTQELMEDDFDRRVHFCEEIMTMLDDNVIQLEHVMFSDECTFTVTGHANRQNCRYWSRENPHWMREDHTQFPEKVNVWAGIIGDHIIGPLFIDGNLNGGNYLELLQNYVVPALANLYPNPENPQVPSNLIWFQQDGAPPHYDINVRHYLNRTFPNRWIGRRGSIEWPARSPDLTSLDFFLWGHIKSIVYKTKPLNLDDLRGRITNAIRSVTPEMLSNVRRHFYLRLGCCQDVRGAHFEHLLD